MQTYKIDGAETRYHSRNTIDGEAMNNDYSEDTPPEQDSQHYSMEIPNEETRQALEAVERREGLFHAKDADDLFRQLGI